MAERRHNGAPYFFPIYAMPHPVSAATTASPTLSTQPDAAASLAVVVRLHQPQALHPLFGVEVAQQTLEHLGQAVDAVLGRLLGQFQPLAHLRHNQQGLWASRFALPATGLQRSAEEVCSSLQPAGQHLVREAVHQVFGAGTGMRLQYSVQVLPCKQEDWAQWLAQGTPAPEQAVQAAAAAAEEEEKHLAQQLQAIMADDNALRTLLQPVVRMADRRIVGYEALSRGPQGSALERPDQLFGAAQACQQTVALELRCAQLALQRTAGRLPQGQCLTLNFGPQALQHWAQQPDSLSLCGHSNIVVELTEHLPLDEAQSLQTSLRHLRQQGVRLALDDTGCGFADLATAQALRPEIVKLCITVVQHATLGDAASQELRHTTEQLHAWGCQVLAEGVETEAQHTALSPYGIALAQGWLYGRPQPWEQALGVEAAQGQAQVQAQAEG